MPDIIYALILSILPIAELRGGIPYALLTGYSVWLSYISCVAVNFLVGPIVFIFLNTVHKILYRISPYQKLFDWFEIGLDCNNYDAWTRPCWGLVNEICMN